MCLHRQYKGKKDEIVVGIERGGEKGKGAQESIPRNEFRQSTYSLLAGRYDNPISTRFLAPIDCLKNRQIGKGRERKGTRKEP